ncbi:MAG: Decaprenyl-phosphate phosphoribosyltransferase [Deltaproteobacteria bacterium ADurb.Bin510]|nr:MAG: Decaprenyl-phosphate phosphoribosyltransferase [Deltaproteobacteria bacterium ADurb.Bin510]
MNIRACIKLLRPHQWLKNGFVFAPIFFGFKLFDSHLLSRTLVAFAAFCLAASAMYVLNDLRDIEADREHPTKRNRPLASGAISRKAAQVILTVLLLAGIATAASLNLTCLGLTLGYIALNTAYSLKLKHLALIDIFCIATGFVLRILMGGFATGIALSHWIVSVTFLLALFLALAKRRDDVKLFLNGSDVRTAIEDYNLKLIDTALAIIAAVTLVAYIMYTVSPEVIAGFGTDYVYLTTVFVLLGLLRYLQLVYVFEEGAAPTMVLIKDRFLQLTIIGWIASFLIIIYKP